MTAPGVMLTEDRVRNCQDVHVLRLLTPAVGFAGPARRGGASTKANGAYHRIGGTIKTVFEHSAGGIVQTAGGKLVVVQTRNLAGRPVVTLPKGLVETGETALSAARREVTEETGYEVRATTPSPAGVTEYWFVRERVRVRKRVEFFRFTVTGGDPARHDGEVDQVLVLEPESAIAMLSYPTEREVVQEALEE